MLGNLVHRATNLVGKYDDGKVAACDSDIIFDLNELIEDTEEAFVEYRLQDAAEAAADAVRATNKYITDMEPWKMKADPVGRTKVLKSMSITLIMTLIVTQIMTRTLTLTLRW